MARSAWTFSLVSVGLAGLLAGCVVTSGDGSGGIGNIGGFGGEPASGGSSGAATGGTGNSSTGGTGNVATGGGAGAGPTVACDPGVSQPLQQCDTTVSDPCKACLAGSTCCVEYAACFGTNPGDRCGSGGPSGTGEFQCLRDCVANPAQFDTSCGALVDPLDIQQCCASGPCNTPTCTGPLGDTTSALMGCINDASKGNPCVNECGFL